MGVANGTATITATVGTFTDSCKVTVGAVAPINIEKADSIAVGDTVYLACDAVSKQYSGPSAATATAFGNGVEFTTKPDADVYALEVVAGSAENSFAFKIKSGDYKDKYLNWASGNTLSVSETLDANSSWTVTISGENKNALIANVADSAREIWWNVSSPRFASYTGKSDGTGYKATQLWKVVGVTPVDIAQPNGNYSGNAIDLEDHEVFTNIALAGNMANVEVGTLVKTLTTYSYDKATGLVTIVLGGNFGNLTAIYDEANDKLTEVTFHGNAAAMMKNNGTLELTAAANLMTCEGSTAELQATFKRRYGDPWTVDTGNADRFTSVDNGITGKGMKVRAYSGGRYAFCFANDFGSPITVSNVGFWVYNSSNKDVTLRMWYYQGTGLTNNGETGTVTAKAGGWTYCRMGFGSKNIYNFQIADFNKTGVELVFDNICLF